ncbi:MAG TPA: hypothetical protein VFX21_02735 [Acidimicrobiia bacterium]|nr:hypothetical protein [Acidimicrobiia bacterium]
MRHITPGRLSQIEGLLVGVRRCNGLTERKPGTFYKKSSAFLHFHEHGDDEVYADCKLDGRTFERVRVTTKREQDALLRRIRKALA